jgi:hypothetical protein
MRLLSENSRPAEGTPFPASNSLGTVDYSVAFVKILSVFSSDSCQPFPNFKVVSTKLSNTLILYYFLMVRGDSF